MRGRRGPGRPGRGGGRGPRGARCRWRTDAGDWQVQARIERFVEPSLLLLLAEGPKHGYELLDDLPEFSGEQRVDLGNLYRLLRSLEEEEIVSSQWDDSGDGPAKRVYWLSDSGRELLDRWADGLRSAQDGVTAFLERNEKRERG